VRWTDRPGGTLYVVDNGTNTVYAVSGPFASGSAYAALDTVGASADTSEVDSLDTRTGALTPFLSGFTKAKGLLYVSPRPSGEAADVGDQASAGTATGHGSQHVAASQRGKHHKRHGNANGARHRHKHRSRLLAT
jgi:hypothetical protein